MPYTGNTITGKERRTIILALANGQSLRAIARSSGLNFRTVRAIANAEQHQITARKIALADTAELNAKLAASRITDELASDKHIPLSLLIPAYGVNIDKFLLLHNEPTENLNVSMKIEGNIFHAFAQFHQDAQRIISARTLPNAHPHSPQDAPPPDAHSLDSPDVSPDALQ
jgi:hypothetical protein